MTRHRGLLVTGLYRSGTTLAERLLDAHPSLAIASQPAPLLHVELKRAFLKEQGRSDAHPFGHRFQGAAHRDVDLVAFLRRTAVGEGLLRQIEKDLHGYSGWWTPELAGHLAGLAAGSYADVLQRICWECARLRPVPEGSPGPDVVGCKEILLEDMLPYLTGEGFAAVIVVRDPRDTILSLSAGRGEQIMGAWRPTLFHVRQFRRSVAAALRLGAAGLAHHVRYDELVSRPQEVLAPVVELLGLDPQLVPVRPSGLRDPRGAPWSGNSSFGENRPELPASVRRYVEFLAGPELVALGMAESWVMPTIEDLAALTEPRRVTRSDFSSGYSTDRDRLRVEVARLERLATRTALSDEAWFLGAGRELADGAGPPAG